MMNGSLLAFLRNDKNLLSQQALVDISSQASRSLYFRFCVFILLTIEIVGCKWHELS